MRQEHWLVQFITLCTGGETASQIKGIDQLREVAWELLTKGRTGEPEKDNLRMASLQGELLGSHV